MENFPVVRNKTEFEVRFYSSNQGHGQVPSDFIYDLLNIQKRLGLNMSEESLVDHIIHRLEPQVMEYVEIRNPTSRSQLLQMITKYEDGETTRVLVLVIVKDEFGIGVRGLPTTVGIEIGEMQG